MSSLFEDTCYASEHYIVNTKSSVYQAFGNIWDAFGKCNRLLHEEV